VLLQRDGELGLLDELLGEVESSGGRVVLVRGEAGIGKSSLVREFASRQQGDAHFHLGYCDDLLIPQPLGPFWDIARAEPTLAKPLEDGDRHGVMAAVLDLLSGRLRSTVVVLEDTQWADEATLDTIKYVGRRIEGANGLLVLTYRDGEVDFEHPLRAVIGELPPENLVRLHLHGLAAPAVELMVEGTDLIAEEVLALTDGNPLFVTQLLAAGVDRVPSSVQDSVIARAAKLSAGARSLLDLVSVVPGAVERSLVESVLAPAREDIAECSRQGLIMEGDATLSFPHELTRRAIEAVLDQSHRRRLNRQVLAALEGWGDPSRLVHHAREAGDVEAIVACAPLAARAAMSIESHREALAHFRALEPYLDRVDPTDRAAIVDEWAHNEFYLDNVEALEILDRAIQLHRSSGDDIALARALTFAVRVNEVNGRPEVAAAASEEAVTILSSLPPGEDLAFALSTRAWLAMMRSERSSALKFADQAIVTARETGNELALIHALNTKGVEICQAGDPAGLEMLEEVSRRAAASGYRFEETRALINLTDTALQALELERAAETAQRARHSAVEHELPLFEAYAKALQAEVLQWKGNWSAAVDLAAEAVDSHPHTRSSAGYVLATVQARQGRSGAKPMLDQTLEVARAIGELQHMAPVASATAEYMWLTGEVDSAMVTLCRQVLDDAVRLEPSWYAGALSLWLWKLGELDAVAGVIPAPYRLLMEGNWQESTQAWSDKGCPYERAVALSHGEGAARLEALEIFETLGGTAAASKLKKALRQDGVPIPRGKARQTRSHAAGLTARQAEVLSLLAESLSNAEIADQLFLSPRTVEHHVAAIMGKLEAGSRDEAVAVAAQQGLLTTG
jgi:DNA-binding CsgD family transcriptional regulator/tetratricopeptide (TPR) repeat protein